MDEYLSQVIIEMRERTASECADDLEAIAASIRTGDGVASLPSRLMMGPRAVSVRLHVLREESGSQQE